MIKFLEILETAPSSYSIFHAKLPPELRGGVALAAFLQRGFGEVAIFEVFDIFLNEPGSLCPSSHRSTIIMEASTLRKQNFRHCRKLPNIECW